MRLVPTAYDHPDAVKLIADLQQVYVSRYGDGDETPVEAAEFAPPRGLFLLGYVDEVPVSSGGWRMHDADEDHFLDGDVELKRMYVADAYRGRGLARKMLAALEEAAVAAGRRRMVLETGTLQPEAIALYTSSGYGAIPNFGHYRCHPLSRCFGKVLVEG